MTCGLGMCYICSHEHLDSHHMVDWGFDVFNAMEPPRNELNEKFNLGHRTLIDWETAKCPCGAPLIGKKESAICSACGTATCSAACHDYFVQSRGMCLFVRNFTSSADLRNIQGLRNIHWRNGYAMQKDGLKEFHTCAKSSPKFIHAMLGPKKNTMWLQRGFRHFGQPQQETLDAFKEIIEDPEDKHFKENEQRLC